MEINMIAYMCKYAPIEIIESFGGEVCLMEPSADNFTQADTLMHPNMCSYVKAILEDFHNREYEGLIFTTCCDSSKRLFDLLKLLYPEKFFYCVDLPRKVNDFTISMYKRQLLGMIAAYEEFSGKTFDPEAFKKICHDKANEGSKNAASVSCSSPGRHNSISADDSVKTAGCPGSLNIALAGSKPLPEIKKLIIDHNVNILLDLTCSGIDRSYFLQGSDLIASYAEMLLNQIPCLRMADASGRNRIMESYADRLHGIIYHTTKFCDIYSYEYASLKLMTSEHVPDGKKVPGNNGVSALPILKIETDATTQCSGQILTRLEAFLESLHTLYDIPTDDNSLSSGGKTVIGTDKRGKLMYVMGIDSGSTSTNAVIMNKDKKIIAHAVVRTGAKSGESARAVLAEVLQKAGLKQKDLDMIVSTGYGRVSIPFADKNVTEISCHGKGAHFLNPSVRTILDIGGQDSKAIHLNQKGDVIDFVMNDKCAAGTGRFLEMMARTLEISIDELGPASLQARENITISSMCSVFAESEVISLIAQNKETADIAHGIHMAIAGKALSLLRRVGLEPGFMMTGGVAKNPGLVKVLEHQLGAPLYIYEEPEIVGAIGAALCAFED